MYKRQLLFWPVFGLLFSYAERFYPVAHYFEMHCALDDLIPFNEWFLTVSYTHLDVYKRQVLLCSFNTSLMPTTGSMPGIKAFTAAVFGGIGSIPGAFLGGLLLGIIEAMAKAYISTNLANSIVFAVLIVVLLVKPAGLLGKYVPEKV